MRIVVTVRCRNEERNIWRFCASYRWADAVLIADGGSTDRSLRIAAGFDNVTVRPFPEVVHSGTSIRNPEGRHTNFLFAWAEEEGADWIIFDDMDCVPNTAFRLAARGLLEAAEADSCEVAFAVRLYLFGEGQHFPHLAKPAVQHKAWEPSLWAWRASLGVRSGDEDWNLSMPALHVRRRRDILPPLCLLHRPWPDEEALARKMALYNGSPVGAKLNDPRNWAGPLERLPEWAYDGLQVGRGRSDEAFALCGGSEPTAEG